MVTGKESEGGRRSRERGRTVEQPRLQLFLPQPLGFCSSFVENEERPSRPHMGFLPLALSAQTIPSYVKPRPFLWAGSNKQIFF